MRLIVLQIVAEIPVAENGGKLIGRGTKLEEEKKSGREKKKNMESTSASGRGRGAKDLPVK